MCKLMRAERVLQGKERKGFTAGVVGGCVAILAHQAVWCAGAVQLAVGAVGIIQGVTAAVENRVRACITIKLPSSQSLAC